MDKRVGLGIGLLLVVLVVAFSGCTSEGAAKETQLKEIKVASLDSMSVFGSKGIIYDIPDNMTDVRVVYNLTGANSYGMGSNGNMGVTSDNVNPNSGQAPSALNNQYLESGPGKTISGEQNFTDHGSFYYSGSFVKGTITIYGTPT